jgi:hypothetical protein
MTERWAASMGTAGSTWQAAGYAGAGNVESLIASGRGRPAVVVGSASGVFEELSTALHLLKGSLVFAVNDIGMYLPHVDHWVSLHVDHMPAWKQVRWLHPKPTEPKIHGECKRPWVDYGWDGLRPLMYLSGYFAMQIAWIMDCDPIVLCGIPGEQRPRFFEGAPRGDGFDYSGKDAGKMLIDEMIRLPKFQMRVRSMSGWTQRFFGGLE